AIFERPEKRPAACLAELPQGHAATASDFSIQALSRSLVFTCQDHKFPALTLEPGLCDRATSSRSVPMKKTMQALVKKKSEPGLWLDEVPVPTIGINDVLIRVLRTGICGTDLHIWKWDAWAQKTIPVPLVVGHEFVGQIVEVGSNVKDFHAGDI